MIETDTSDLSQEKDKEYEVIERAKYFHEHHASKLDGMLELIRIKKYQEFSNTSLFIFLDKIENDLGFLAVCLRNGYFDEKDIVCRLEASEQTLKSNKRCCSTIRSRRKSTGPA